jgi:flavoprotein, HI0933 family/uncharacterized flavoprotein, PP_4765 family
MRRRPNDYHVRDSLELFMSEPAVPSVAIIGGGPAGLMAAEALAQAGVKAAVYESKPSFGRKFLRAGVGGLNLTHAEPYDQFCARYGPERTVLQPMLDAFGPDVIRRWAAELGIATFVGSSGKVFPVGMKAAPLLRAWGRRLAAAGVSFHLRHRWVGWDDAGALRFETPDGQVSVAPRATVLALGGGSWPQLGSDAAWVPWLVARGVSVAPLLSANCGFQVAWSDVMRQKYAGAQLKAVSLRFTDAEGHTEIRTGELVVTDYGVEGSLIYAFSRKLRAAVLRDGAATFYLDLAPGRSRERVEAELLAPRGARSMSSHLQSRLGLKGVKTGLLREVVGPQDYTHAAVLAAAIKALPITVTGMRPLSEAISSAGGIRFDSVDESLMLRALPGVFAAGEMLDWEAPTGGYLLTACMAQGAWAGKAAAAWLRQKP